MAPLLPSTRLLACPACHEHVKSDATSCPHCGADLPERNRFGRAASAALVGLALSGCPDKDTMTTTLEPEYGVATTEPMTTGNTTDGGTGTGTDTTAGTGTGTSMTGPEPEYGVPTTDATTTTTGPEPDYGVPGTTSTSTTGTTGTGTGGEPEYGVPMTTAEPDYGVPGTTGA